LKFNWRKWDANWWKSIANMLMNIVFGKNKNWMHKSKKDIFPFFFIYEWAKQVIVWNSLSDNLQLMEFQLHFRKNDLFFTNFLRFKQLNMNISSCIPLRRRLNALKRSGNFESKSFNKVGAFFMITFQKSWYTLILLASLKLEGSKTYNFRGIDSLR
jgi:hypothetical protein